MSISIEKVQELQKKGRVLVTLKQNLLYDVTDFLEDHPGGAELISDLKNTDVTSVMNDEELHQHSEAAYVVMQEYLVGKLPPGVSLEASNTKTPASKTTSTASATPGLAYGVVGVSSGGDDDMSPEFHADMDIGSSNLQKDDAHERMLIEALHQVTDAERDYKENKFIDLNKPMLLQVMLSNWDVKFYIDQVHRPRHYKYGSAPIFGNFLEPISLTPWWIIPIIWVPANLLLQTVALRGVYWYTHAFLYLFGICLWTLVEYTLHRCLFHLDDHLPNNRVAITLHFLMHGVHHFLPMDRMRLVMPPALMIVLTTPLYHLCHFVFRHYYGSMSIFCGAHMGYVIYDLTHYFLHHKRLPQFFKDTKVWHLDHHYKDFQRGFGVTTRFWDVVFGTQYVDTSK